MLEKLTWPRDRFSSIPSLELLPAPLLVVYPLELGLVMLSFHISDMSDGLCSNRVLYAIACQILVQLLLSHLAIELGRMPQLFLSLIIIPIQAIVFSCPSGVAATVVHYTASVLNRILDDQGWLVPCINRRKSSWTWMSQATIFSSRLGRSLTHTH
jgi:hypothetical protein